MNEASKRLEILGGALDVDLPELRTEIGQVVSLVEDAVLQAQSAFYSLAARVRRQRDLVGELVATSDGSGEGQSLSRFALEARPLFERLANALQASTSGAEADLAEIERLLGRVIDRFGEIDCNPRPSVDDAGPREVDALETTLAALRACTCESSLSVEARRVEALSSESHRESARVVAALRAAESLVAELIAKVRRLGESGVTNTDEARAVTNVALIRLQALDTRLSDVLRELVESGVETDHHAATAVRALQFGDMVSQILACSRDRVARLEHVSNLVRSTHADAEKDVEESYRLRSLRSPVTSSDVSSGDVELF